VHIHGAALTHLRQVCAFEIVTATAAPFAAAANAASTAAAHAAAGHVEFAAATSSFHPATGHLAFRWTLADTWHAAFARPGTAAAVIGHHDCVTCVATCLC
jgi:hypothetical protein